MTTLSTHPASLAPVDPAPADAAPGMLARMLSSRRAVFGGVVLLAIVLLCVTTLPWTLGSGPLGFNAQDTANDRLAPSLQSLRQLFGTDDIGRSLLGRVLLGGCISLAVGIASATISVVLGVTVGLIAGYKGGWTDALLMRTVDIMYGLPYILLVILLKIALERPLVGLMGNAQAANLVVLFAAIGLVSWLTMARVVRGQVLSLRNQPFIEAARAAGIPGPRIFLRHVAPNLVGPVIVYATLTVPVAILQESFLSFLGVGVTPPLPSWGSLASEGLNPALSPIQSLWWLLLFPCIFLSVTLLSLNFLGDGLRDVLDPRRDAAKI